jgi:hypothetical protein
MAELSLGLIKHNVMKKYDFLTSALDRVVSFTPRPLHPRETNTQYPFNRRLD